MEEYLKENVSIAMDYYVISSCNTPWNPFSRNDDDVHGKMLIVQSLDQDCMIWLNKEKESVHIDSRLLLSYLKERVNGGNQIEHQMLTNNCIKFL